MPGGIGCGQLNRRATAKALWLLLTRCRWGGVESIERRDCKPGTADDVTDDERQDLRDLYVMAICDASCGCVQIRWQAGLAALAIVRTF